MKTFKVKIDRKTYAEYNSFIGELNENNADPISKSTDYEIKMPSHHEVFFKEKNGILLNDESELYSNKRALSELQINTMLAIAFSSREEYQLIFNGEMVYKEELIEAFQNYFTLLDQIYNLEKVKAEFYIPNQFSSGKKNKIVLSDSKIKLDTLSYLKEVYKYKVLGLCEDIFTLFGNSTELELVYKVNLIASKDLFKDLGKSKEMTEFKVFFEDALNLKYDEVLRLIEQFNNEHKKRPKKISDRKGIYFRHIFSNLQSYLENHTEISQKKYPIIKDSEQHRIIHYVCAMAGIVPFAYDFARQAQTVKDILKNRL